jgi:hypothetical protein
VSGRQGIKADAATAGDEAGQAKRRGRAATASATPMCHRCASPGSLLGACGLADDREGLDSLTPTS